MPWVAICVSASTAGSEARGAGRASCASVLDVVPARTRRCPGGRRRPAPTTCSPNPLSSAGCRCSCCSPDASTTQSHPQSAGSVSPASSSTRSLDADGGRRRSNSSGCCAWSALDVDHLGPGVDGHPGVEVGATRRRGGRRSSPASSTVDLEPSGSSCSQTAAELGDAHHLVGLAGVRRRRRGRRRRRRRRPARSSAPPIMAERGDRRRAAWRRGAASGRGRGGRPGRARPRR